MIKFKISRSTISRLKCVDARLVILFSTYLSLNKKDIGVTYGARTTEAQEHLLKTGKTQVKNSKHLLFDEVLTTPDGYSVVIKEANAIDIVAYKDGKPVWDREYYKDIIEDMKNIVKHFGWQDDFNFGWDFKTLNDPYHISVKEPGDGGIK